MFLTCGQILERKRLHQNLTRLPAHEQTRRTQGEDDDTPRMHPSSPTLAILGPNRNPSHVHGRDRDISDQTPQGGYTYTPSRLQSFFDVLTSRISQQDRPSKDLPPVEAHEAGKVATGSFLLTLDYRLRVSRNSLNLPTLLRVTVGFNNHYVRGQTVRTDGGHINSTKALMRTGGHETYVTSAHYRHSNQFFRPRRLAG